ncbi:MAG TPA: histidine phosphatase family protein [Candidatus Saccharimonadales bacterium]|nr:histidine phosphatase family protein [Candidatus Saccharimonadales bacterium]
MKRLYFIRHGESTFNASGRWAAGSSDTPLTAKGRGQARRAGQKAREEGLGFDIIISSPLARAFDTAKIIAAELGYPEDKIVLSDKFIERDFGKLEGRRDLVAGTKYFIDESAIDSYDGVEKLIDLQARMDEFLEYVRGLPQDTVLVVGHGGSGRALRRAIQGEPLSKRGESLGNAELVRFI